jgi:hypothetical protein
MSVSRYLGILDVNNPGNVIDYTAHTMAVDAIYAMQHVMYRKAVKLDPGHGHLFHPLIPADKFQNLNLISFFANSIGPIETEGPPYRCTFIPYFTEPDLRNVRNNMYNARMAKQFILSVAKGYTQVELSMIDPYNEETSPYWLLYPVQGINSSTVYNPMSFSTADNATYLAAALLDSPLYDLPGPLCTGELGYYVSASQESNPLEVPNSLRTRSALNPNQPVQLTIVQQVRQATLSDLITYGRRQGNQAMYNKPHISVRDPEEWMNRTIHGYQAYIDHLQDEFNENKQSKPKSGKRKGNAPPLPSTPLGQDPFAPDSDYYLHQAQVLYFDHILMNDFPHNRRVNIITEALLPQVRPSQR